MKWYIRLSSASLMIGTTSTFRVTWLHGLRLKGRFGFEKKPRLGVGPL